MCGFQFVRTLEKMVHDNVRCFAWILSTRRRQNWFPFFVWVLWNPLPFFSFLFVCRSFLEEKGGICFQCDDTSLFLLSSGYGVPLISCFPFFSCPSSPPPLFWLWRDSLDLVFFGRKGSWKYECWWRFGWLEITSCEFNKGEVCVEGRKWLKGCLFCHYPPFF